MSISTHTLSIGDDAIAEMRDRILRTRWPHKIAHADGWDRGVPLEYLKKLATYWAEDFDWQSMEVLINGFSQYLYTFEGQSIHFFHVKSQDPHAKPLLLLHGWPSSGIEYLKVIDLLTERAAGGQSFHLVIPTIPGFGLSPPPLDTGWHSPRMARACSALMCALGYERYCVHGSDIGGDIMNELAVLDDGRVIAVHQASDTRTATISVGMFMGDGNPSDNPALSDDQRQRVGAVLASAESDMAYLQQQATRPFTLGYGLADSPIGQLAWVIEKYKNWTKPSDALPEVKLDIDQVLANVSLYWLNGAGPASASYIYENMNAAREWGRVSHAPRGYAIFDCEDFVRLLIDSDQKASHWSEFTEGGHFPAMEVPDLLATDISAFFAACD